MTPKEFKFLCQTLEETARAAYRLGHEEGAGRKPLNAEQFKLSDGNRLTIKKEINKLTKTR